MNVQGSIAFESLNPSEVAKAANLFDTLKQLRLKLKNGDQQVLERAFELHVQGVLEKLDSRLPGITNIHEHAVELIMARHGLYDATFQQVVLLCQSIAPALGESVRELRNLQSGFIGEFQQVIASMNLAQDKTREALTQRDNKILELEEDIRKLKDVGLALNQENQALNQNVLELRGHIRALAQEVNQYRESHPSNSKTAYYPPFDTANTVSSPRSLKRTSSAGSLSNPSVLSPQPHYTRAKTPSKRDESFLSGAYFPDETQGESQRGGLNTPSKGPLSLTQPAHWLRSFREDVQRAIDEGRCRDITLKECKETIERVYESKVVANQKAQQGMGNLPLETMEQHLFRTLEKKYGLRDLAVVHAGMLLKALQRHVADNDVAVFQQIIRNEVEEDFRLVQRDLTKSIKDLTLVQLMSRHPTKDQATLSAMLEQKMSAGSIGEDEWKDMVGYLYNEADSAALCSLLRRAALMERELAEGPAVSISTNNNPMSPLTSPQGGATATPPRSSGTLSPYFSLPTSHLQQSKIQRPASYTIGTPNAFHHSADAFKSGQIGYDRKEGRDVKRLGYSSRTLSISMIDPQAKQRKRDKLKLSFPVFLKTILDFQLHAHEEYLGNFAKIFRHVDRNGDGVLSAQEFRKFYSMLRKVTEDSEVLAVLLQQPQTPLREGRGAFDFTQLEEQAGLLGEQEGSEEELATFLSLMKMLDPFETDRVTFSSAVSCLHHIQNEFNNINNSNSNNNNNNSNAFSSSNQQEE